ncbi:BolA-like protein [Apiospora marii]|uniref:BolA-like protein n=1 Tax=Apiospora marii TaxID=335849 RepID=UPI00312CE8EA
MNGYLYNESKAELGLTRMPQVPTAFRQSSLIHARLYSTSPDASAPATPASPSALNALEKPDSLDEAESSIWDKLTAEFARSHSKSWMYRADVDPCH